MKFMMLCLRRKSSSICLLCEIFIFHSSIFIILGLIPLQPVVPSFSAARIVEVKKVIISLCWSLTWSVIISKHSGTTHFVFHFRDYCLIHCFKIASAENWLWKIINKFQTVNLTNDRHTQFQGMETSLLLLNFTSCKSKKRKEFFALSVRHAHKIGSVSGERFPSLFDEAYEKQ